MLRLGVMLFLNYSTLIDPLLKDLRTFVAEFAGMKPGQRVLDVCCGTGAQVLEYGHRGIIATGIDLSPEMLRIAERNRVKENQYNVFFQLADAANLPFADNQFDCASISFGLHDKVSSARSMVVSEMIRVVKQQGALVLVDFQIPLPRNMWAIITHSLEFMIDGSHYAGFKDYIHNGGLDNILKTHNLREEQREHLKRGLVAIIKAKVNLASS
jgi:ubiquinone/menaquinone biosynthesis C-methylase UbiE